MNVVVLLLVCPLLLERSALGQEDSSPVHLVPKVRVEEPGKFNVRVPPEGIFLYPRGGGLFAEEDHNREMSRRGIRRMTVAGGKKVMLVPKAAVLRAIRKQQQEQDEDRDETKEVEEGRRMEGEGKIVEHINSKKVLVM